MNSPLGLKIHNESSGLFGTRECAELDASSFSSSSCSSSPSPLIASAAPTSSSQATVAPNTNDDHACEAERTGEEDNDIEIEDLNSLVPQPMAPHPSSATNGASPHGETVFQSGNLEMLSRPVSPFGEPLTCVGTGVTMTEARSTERENSPNIFAELSGALEGIAASINVPGQTIEYRSIHLLVMATSEYLGGRSLPTSFIPLEVISQYNERLVPTEFTLLSILDLVTSSRLLDCSSFQGALLLKSFSQCRRAGVVDSRSERFRDAAFKLTALCEGSPWLVSLIASDPSTYPTRAAIEFRTYVENSLKDVIFKFASPSPLNSPQSSQAASSVSGSISSRGSPRRMGSVEDAPQSFSTVQAWADALRALGVDLPPGIEFPQVALTDQAAARADVLRAVEGIFEAGRASPVWEAAYGLCAPTIITNDSGSIVTELLAVARARLREKGSPYTRIDRCIICRLLGLDPSSPHPRHRVRASVYRCGGAFGIRWLVLVSSSLNLVPLLPSLANDSDYLTAALADASCALVCGRDEKQSEQSLYEPAQYSSSSTSSTASYSLDPSHPLAEVAGRRWGISCGVARRLAGAPGESFNLNMFEEDHRTVLLDGCELPSFRSQVVPSPAALEPVGTGGLSSSQHNSR